MSYQSDKDNNPFCKGDNFKRIISALKELDQKIILEFNLTFTPVDEKIEQIQSLLKETIEKSESYLNEQEIESMQEWKNRSLSLQIRKDK